MASIQADIEAAAEVAAEARLLREDLRWTVKPGDPDRGARIDSMIEEIRLAMVPIRSWIGKAGYGQVGHEDKLAEVSQELQYERKQLKKMRR